MLFLDILTFPVGVVVDAVTGGWYKLEPNAATLTLQKTDLSMTGPDRIEVTLTMAGNRAHPTATVDSTEPGVLLEILTD